MLELKSNYENIILLINPLIVISLKLSLLLFVESFIIIEREKLENKKL
jgi:hypothetical protein